MSAQLFFTTCGGEVARLNAVSYQPHMWGNKDPLPARNVRMMMACGGGKPTLYYYAFGQCAGCSGWHYAERMIKRPSSPSGHVCGGKCRAARGPSCECSCGGSNHGAN